MYKMLLLILTLLSPGADLMAGNPPVIVNAKVIPSPTAVVLCDGCSPQQRRQVAIEGAKGYGHVLVGDRTNGYLYKYIVNILGNPNAPIPPGVIETTASESQAEEFLLYAEAFRVTGSVGVIAIEANVKSGAQSLPVQFPGSAFDVTMEGAARHSLTAYLSNTDNWSGSDQRTFYAKLIVQQGKSLMTGGEFTIRISARFPDGSSVVMNYDSSKQSLVFVEARDSAGNLIATNSSEPVHVDYSWYERHEARNGADYGRAIQWLRAQGVARVGAGGGISIARGTVLVGGVVNISKK